MMSPSPGPEFIKTGHPFLDWSMAPYVSQGPLMWPLVLVLPLVAPILVNPWSFDVTPRLSVAMFL
jgi:hypothetical protein